MNMTGQIIQMVFFGITLVVSITVVNSILKQTRAELGIDNITTTETPVNTTTIPDISNPTTGIVLLVVILIAILIVAFILWKRRSRSK